MIRLARFLLILCLLQLGPLPGQGEEEVFQDITVRSGQTLWDIANKYLKDPRRWTDIIKHNNLNAADPTVPLPGTVVKVPVLLIKEEYRNAQLIQMIPEVRYRRKGAQDWKEANADMTLNYEDSLRTMKGAKARVQFPSKEIVQINENTYVVLKPEKILQEVELLRGEVRASRAKVIMPRGTVVQPRGDGSDYQAKIREDDSEVVFVYKGKVDVTAQGKTVTVREGFGTEVFKGKAPNAPLPLTSFSDFDPLEMTAKIDNNKITPINPLDKASQVKAPSPDAKRNAKASKTVSSKNILTNYTMQLASDKDFKNIVLETSHPIGTAFDVAKSNIPDGTYFMKVAFTDAFGVQGPYSHPTRIEKDTKAPVIKNLFPKEGQTFSGDEGYCDVIGEVEGAVTVSINDEIVIIGPTGRFNKFLTLKPGANVIKVLARDLKGNETITNRKVIYTP